MRILIVEDDVGMTALLRRGLREDDYSVAGPGFSPAFLPVAFDRFAPAATS